MPEMREVIDKLNRLYSPDDHVAVVIWTQEDVVERANERNMTISPAEAQEILDLMDRKHDCSIGITWDTIDVYLDELKYSPHR